MQQAGLNARRAAAEQSARLPGVILQLMQPPLELATVDPADARWQDLEALLPQCATATREKGAARAAAAAAAAAERHTKTTEMLAGDEESLLQRAKTLEAAGQYKQGASVASQLKSDEGKQLFRTLMDHVKTARKAAGGGEHPTWVEPAFTNGHAVTQAVSSGVFAVRNGTVQAAVEGVAPDTMRELVFVVCEKLGIPLIYSAPALAESKLWEAAFITHPAHGLVPVSAIRVRREACPHLRGMNGQPAVAASEMVMVAGPAGKMQTADGWATAGEVAAAAANKAAAGDDADGSMFVPVRPSSAAVAIVAQLTTLVSSELLRPREVEHTKLIESSAVEVAAVASGAGGAAAAAAPVAPNSGFGASMAAAKQKREAALEAEAAGGNSTTAALTADTPPAPKTHIDKVASMLHSRMRVALSDGRCVDAKSRRRRCRRDHCCCTRQAHLQQPALRYSTCAPFATVS